MLKSSLCDSSYINKILKGKITSTGRGEDATATQSDERNKQVASKVVHHPLKV